MKINSLIRKQANENYLEVPEAFQELAFSGDEATSALDSLTEDEITCTLREISAGKKQIILMIAHRLSTIMHANRIYVLEKGKIVEEGSHDTLLENKGLYYAMWRQQIGERKSVARYVTV